MRRFEEIRDAVNLTLIGRRGGHPPEMGQYGFARPLVTLNLGIVEVEAERVLEIHGAASGKVTGTVSDLKLRVIDAHRGQAAWNLVVAGHAALRPPAETLPPQTQGALVHLEQTCEWPLDPEVPVVPREAAPWAVIGLSAIWNAAKHPSVKEVLPWLGEASSFRRARSQGIDGIAGSIHAWESGYQAVVSS